MNAGIRRIRLACGFLLHQRPYRDSSLILELFARDHGRLSAFAHGARGPRSRFAGLQPFRPLLLSWSGRGESPTLSAAEDAGPPPPPFPPARILSAFYLNELLLKLTVAHDPQPELYAHYAATLARLRALEPLEAVLRHFEKRLLELLGYGNDLRCEAGGRPVAADAYYHFRPGAGIWPAAMGGDRGTVDAARAAGAGLVQGRVLLALAADEPLADPEGRRQARLVLGAALDHCLDGRELRARTVAHAVARMERPA
ncbi:MAG: DNA repair protein RecO [Gammaproteobacteria bacterium]|nr:DNA repair protein RecO [Gammaproteobacteria bacterium]